MSADIHARLKRAADDYAKALKAERAESAHCRAIGADKSGADWVDRRRGNAAARRVANIVLQMIPSCLGGK